MGLAHQDMMDAAQRFRQIPFTAGAHLVVECVNTQIIINMMALLGSVEKPSMSP